LSFIDNWNLEEMHAIEEAYEHELFDLKQLQTQELNSLRRDREIEVKQLTTDYQSQITEIKSKAQQERLISDQRLKAYMAKLKDLN
jgi:hypothetical protein